MKIKIKAEWDQLREVMIHRPGVEVFFGLLAPEAFLYEGPFDYMEACKEHEVLEAMLKHDLGIKVLSLKNVILDKAREDGNFKNELIENALSVLWFENGEKAEEARKDFQKNIDVYGMEHFLNILILRPTVQLIRYTEEAISPRVVLRTPLVNLFYVRDQQAITDKGVVIGRPKKLQRREEPSLTKLAFKALNVNIVHEVKPPGTFEGGDFMPLGDFALVGLGERTNINGKNQILKFGIDFPEVGVVSNPYHKSLGKFDPMVTMHLDTYFNVAGKKIAVGHKELLETAKVEVYQKDGEEYKLKKETNLYLYLREKGFEEPIKITTLEQLSYASNFLCVKDKCILTVDVRKIAKRVLTKYFRLVYEEKRKEYKGIYEEARRDYDRLRLNGEFFPYKKEMYEYAVDFELASIPNLTGGFGGIHCMTCALLRR